MGCLPERKKEKRGDGQEKKFPNIPTRTCCKRNRPFDILFFKLVGRPWVQYPVWQHTFVSPSAFSRRAVVSNWRKYVHEVLVNRLGGLSLPRNNVVRLTDRPNMTLDVYRGRKTTMQQQQHNPHKTASGHTESSFR